MRAAGRSIADIADALYGGKADTARRDISRALSSVVQEAGEELRTLETTRTEAILAAAFDIINNPDASDRDKAYALREATRVLDRRAKLLGLDADSKAAHARNDAGDIEHAKSLIGSLTDNVTLSVELETMADWLATYRAAFAMVAERHGIPADELPTPPPASAAFDTYGYEYDPWAAERVSDLPPQA